MWKELKVVFLGIGAFLLAVSLFGGAISGAIEASDFGRCKYTSIASLWPTRVISCEVFKQRWKKDP